MIAKGRSGGIVTVWDKDRFQLLEIIVMVELLNLKENGKKEEWQQ